MFYLFPLKSVKSGSVCCFGAMFSTLPLGGAGQSFALKGQYIPARRIAAGSIAQEINAL
jgi:hypothetical protein